MYNFLTSTSQVFWFWLLKIQISEIRWIRHLLSFYHAFKRLCQFLTGKVFEAIIVKIDSITYSFCLCQYIWNGLSYSAEETQPTLCKPMPSNQLGFRDREPNKHQLLHRIQSIWTITNLQYYIPQYLDSI